MNNPAAASWDKWADEPDADDDGEEEEEEVEDGKDYSVPTEGQSHVFDKALKLPPGSRGALPSEIHDLWNTLQRWPGAAQERHALRNAIVPNDAGYGHVCKIDPNGEVMNRIRTVWEIKQKEIQT